MDQATKTRLRSTLAALIAAVAFLAPDIAKWIGAVENASGWVSTVIRFVGFAVAICTDGRGVALLNIFLPTVTSGSKSERPKDFPGTVAGLVLVGTLLLSGTAHAQSPQYGGCFVAGKVCLGPSATITVGQLNLTTSKFTGGVLPGVGYGATYAQDQWYATGLALYAAFRVGQGQPNQVTPAVVLSFANYLRIGLGAAITETSGALDRQWLLLFGIGSDLGGSPKYVQEQRVSARPKLAAEDF